MEQRMFYVDALLAEIAAVIYHWSTQLHSKRPVSFSLNQPKMALFQVHV